MAGVPNEANPRSTIDIEPEREGTGEAELRLFLIGV